MLKIISELTDQRPIRKILYDVPMHPNSNPNSEPKLDGTLEYCHIPLRSSDREIDPNSITDTV